MSMQKLRGIRNTGAYTAQRNMVEHLLRLEEIILQEIPGSILPSMNIPEERKRLAQYLEEYKEQNQIHKAFDIEDIQHYLFTTIEQNLPWEKSEIRGIYTSTLIEQVEGDEPIIIDMQGKKIDDLLLAINTPRHITINNTKGDHTGAYAGSHHGTAHLTINNTNGNDTGTWAGSQQGNAHITINNTKGDNTGAYAGPDGRSIIIITNTEGNYTGAWGGNQRGNVNLTIINNQGSSVGENFGWDGDGTIIVAYNCQGIDQFFGHKGPLVLNNPGKKLIIEGVTREQKTDILNLIKQNTPSEDIMAYLRRCT